MIMMLGIHSKIVFSLFAASKLKKRIEKEELKNQYGPKPAGVEAVVHIFQSVRTQNPDFDVFLADAVNYNLNRDLALRKIKEEALQVFNLFMDKYNNSSNALFFGLAQGVARFAFAQSEGGNPGSPPP